MLEEQLEVVSYWKSRDKCISKEHWSIGPIKDATALNHDQITIKEHH